MARPTNEDERHDPHNNHRIRTHYTTTHTFSHTRSTEIPHKAHEQHNGMNSTEKAPLLHRDSCDP